MKMIKAGVYFLEAKTGTKRKEILNMFYPDFKDQISYYADPEKYLKTEIKEEEVQERINDIKDKLDKF